MRAIRLGLMLCALAGGAGCEPMAPHDEHERVVTLEQSTTLLVDNHRITALDTETGKMRWQYARNFYRQPEYGRHARPVIRCIPGRTKRGEIIVSFIDRIVALDLDNGRRVWKTETRHRGECPVVTPDSAVVLVHKHPLPSGTIAKYGPPHGGRRWRYENPVIGAIRDLSVDDTSGSVLARGASHLLSISPDGKRNWIRRIDHQ